MGIPFERRKPGRPIGSKNKKQKIGRNAYKRALRRAKKNRELGLPDAPTADTSTSRVNDAANATSEPPPPPVPCPERGCTGAGQPFVAGRHAKLLRCNTCGCMFHPNDMPASEIDAEAEAIFAANVKLLADSDYYGGAHHRALLDGTAKAKRPLRTGRGPGHSRRPTQNEPRAIVSGGGTSKRIHGKVDRRRKGGELGPS